MSDVKHSVDGQSSKCGVAKAEGSAKSGGLCPLANDTNKTQLKVPSLPELLKESSGEGANPFDCNALIMAFAELGMKDPATRVLLERVRDWQASQSATTSQPDLPRDTLEDDADETYDVSSDHQ
jgi:hypothetical protein